MKLSQVLVDGTMDNKKGPHKTGVLGQLGQPTDISRIAGTGGVVNASRRVGCRTTISVDCSSLYFHNILTVVIAAKAAIQTFAWAWTPTFVGVTVAEVPISPSERFPIYD